MSTFREPTRELPMPNEIRLGARRDWLGLRGSVWTVDEAEALLEVLLDICPNAEALAHNLSVESSRTAHKAMQKVRPLTSDECQQFHECDIWNDMDNVFEQVMAARGIEVGE